MRSLIVTACALVAATAFAAQEPHPTRIACHDRVIESKSRVAEAPPLPDTAAFLLGSGLALLIALLAWGEQIRTITRDTRDLERDFLDLTHLTRAELSALLQAKTDDDRLVAFTNLIASDKLTSASQVEILPLFERWRVLGTTLQSLQSRKYWLTILLTVVFFSNGVVAAFTEANLVSTLFLVTPPSLLVIALLWIVISAGRVEQQLNKLLVQIAEKV